MEINLEITERELRSLVLIRLQEIMGDTQISESDITIMVKSKQNYSSEWETAAFKAIIRKNTVL